MPVGRLLYVGAGHDRQIPHFEEFRGLDLVTLDADPSTEPDVLGDMCDLCTAFGCRGRGSHTTHSAVYSRHSLEHVPTWRVVPALRSWRDHLDDGGLVVVQVPDLTAACRVLLDRGADATMYVAGMGPIRPLDVLYGHARESERNQLYQHQTGFTRDLLAHYLKEAGFTDVRVGVLAEWDLIGVGYRR